MKEMIVYHGSAVSFDQFNIQKSKQVNEHGFGLYFGLDKSFALPYATKYLYTVQAKLNKALSNTKVTLSKKQLQKILIKLHQTNNILNDFDDTEYVGEAIVLNQAVNLLLRSHKNDVNLINDLINITGDPIAVMNILKAMHYTHSFINNNSRCFSEPNILLVWDDTILSILNKENTAQHIQIA